MLYLLLDFIVDDRFLGHEILKIGYSSKEFSSSREHDYNTHNYGYRLVCEIEGTKEDETRLHRKYKQLLLPGSTEWFKYSDDIVKEFYPDAEPDEDMHKIIESISPITLKTLEKEYLPSIIDPDYLLGTIDSIYARIDRSVDAARNIWKELLSGTSIKEVEDRILKKIEETDLLLSFYDDPSSSSQSKQTVAEKLKRVSEYDFRDYIVVVGNRPNYEVKFNTGLLKIEQLALEAYKTELDKRNKI